MISMKASPVKLDKPGAGLPFFEWLIAKYFIVPRLLRNKSQEMAMSKFASSSSAILKTCRQIDPDKFLTQVLIPRLRGLEDSSRFWSVSMTLEHLIITNNRLASLLPDLASGKTAIAALSISDVKPGGTYNACEALEFFEVSFNKVIDSAKALDLNAFPQARYAHPWFGPLDALDWLTFASMHNRIHLQQIEQISIRLENS